MKSPSASGVHYHLNKMATPVDHKKKSLHQHRPPAPVDGGSGMSVKTKRHFDRVKQKMFAFVDRQQQFEHDAMQPPAPMPFSRHLPSPFLDQRKAPAQPSHHRTPQLGHKHHHVPSQGQLHKQLPHLGLATPQVNRREGRSRMHQDGRRSPNVAFF